MANLEALITSGLIKEGVDITKNMIKESGSTLRDKMKLDVEKDKNKQNYDINKVNSIFRGCIDSAEAICNGIGVICNAVNDKNKIDIERQKIVNDSIARADKHKEEMEKITRDYERDIKKIENSQIEFEKIMDARNRLIDIVVKFKKDTDNMWEEICKADNVEDRDKYIALFNEQSERIVSMINDLNRIEKK